MESVAPCVPQVGGRTAEPLFRSVPCRRTVTVSPIGVVAEQARILGRTIRLQLQWADRSRRRRPSLIIDAKQYVEVHADEKLTAFVELGDTWNFLNATAPMLRKYPPFGFSAYRLTIGETESNAVGVMNCNRKCSLAMTDLRNLARFGNSQNVLPTIRMITASRSSIPTRMIMARVL
jgi:hypothetical protein